MILYNGQRYFNVALDSSRGEFVVRSIRPRVDSSSTDQKKLYFSNPTTNEDRITTQLGYKYQPSLTLGGQFYSTTEGKYLYNAAFDVVQARPNSVDDEPLILRDSGGEYGARNAIITTGSEGRQSYALIKPGYNNVTVSETLAPGHYQTSDPTPYGSLAINTGNPYINISENSPLQSSSYRMNIYISAWFLCQYDNLFTIPDSGGIQVDVTGVFPNSEVPSGQVLHTCSLATTCRTLLESSTAGHVLVCVTGGDTVKLLPDDMSSAQGSTDWTQIRDMSVPVLKVFLNSGGFIKICQWGFEFACGTINAV